NVIIPLRDVNLRPMPVSFLLIALPKIKAIPTTGVNNACHRFQQNPGRSEE
ncbi:Hypothetical predicted protein, partial [Paramuricea clavata]